MGFDETKAGLMASPKAWAVTGVAGFIGSNLLETLLRWNQKVIGLDNFSTGYPGNLAQVQSAVGAERWNNFTFIQGDIQEAAACRQVVAGADYILHQAALGSVPRSLEHPDETHASNVTGFVNMLCAARENGNKRFVYASSSSVYGDAATLPQVENNIGECLSPYAVSKRTNELYAAVFARCYGIQCVGLRYFNVFGPRQDPAGPYAAVIPKWIAAMMDNEPVCINGDGSTTRDFCPVANVVQANILAATAASLDAVNTVYNIALGNETSLSELCQMLRKRLLTTHPHLRELRPVQHPFRPGDIRHSRADIGKARRLLGYAPTTTIEKGLDDAVNWNVAMRNKQKAAQPASAEAFKS